MGLGVLSQGLCSRSISLPAVDQRLRGVDDHGGVRDEAFGDIRSNVLKRYHGPVAGRVLLGENPILVVSGIVVRVGCVRIDVVLQVEVHVRRPKELPGVD